MDFSLLLLHVLVLFVALAQLGTCKRPPEGDATVMYACHSHNDYSVQKPALWRAVSLGIGSVEADIWLVDGTLYIGHSSTTNETLSGLYLDPLRQKVAADGYVWPWPSRQPLNLLIDLKSEGLSTFAALNALIDSQYSDLFSFRDAGGALRQSFLNCVVTGNGNVPIDFITKMAAPRYCSIDAPNLWYGSQLSEALSPMTSMNFETYFGSAQKLNDTQLALLRSMVEESRKYRKRLRFWATPNSVPLWTQLLQTDGQRNVIVLSADELPEARQLLVELGYNSTNQQCARTPQWCSQP